MVRHSMMKNMIAAVLVFALMSSMMLCVSAADTNVYDTAEYQLLEDLGVYNSSIGNDEFNKNVSRGDAAKYIADFLKLDPDQYANTVIPYSDVSGDDINYDAICALYSVKIISEGSEFRPGDAITSIEALKMIMVALGYEEIAAVKGGYPLGYISIASRLGLNSYAKDIPITTGELFKLLNDSIDIDVMEFSGQYIETSNGVSILEKYRGILKETGVVSANRDTDIETMDGASSVHDNEIKINGKTLKDLNDKAYNLIGIESDIYYDKNTEEIISAVSSKKIETLKIFSQDIEEVEDEYTIVYYDNSKDKRVRISLNPQKVKVLKNNVYTALFGKSDLNIEEGYIELYDTDSDGGYELAKIVSPEVFIVDKASNNRVYFKYGKTYNSKNYIEKDADTTFYIDGNEVETNEFVEWDIINIYATNSGARVRVECEYNRVSGTLNSIKNDSVIIDGREYKINPKGNFNASDFEIGSSIDTYLDLTGRIYVASKAAISSSEENLKLGYICEIGVKEKLFGGGEARFKMYNSNMDFEYFFAAPKLKIYGKENKKGIIIDSEKESSLDELKAFLVACGDGKSESQIVKYKLDADNKITTLYCAVPKADLNDADGNYPLILSYDKDSSSPSSDRHSYTGTLNFAYSVNWGFDYWNVPENKEDEELYSIVLAQNMGISGSGYTFDEIKLYNVNSNGQPEFALRVSKQITGKSLDDGSPTGVISEIGNTKVNDDIISYMKVYSYGSVKTLYMDNDFMNQFNGEKYFYEGTKVSDLKPGDIIAFKTNEKNYINALRILVRNSDRGDYRIEVMKTSDKILVGDILEKPTQVIHMVYGEVVETDGGAAVSIKTGASNKTSYLFRNDGRILQRYTIINTGGRNPIINVGVSNDICVGDKVVFRWTWKGIDDVFVYKD